LTAKLRSTKVGVDKSRALYYSFHTS